MRQAHPVTKIPNVDSHTLLTGHLTALYMVTSAQKIGPCVFIDYKLQTAPPVTKIQNAPSLSRGT